MNSISGFGFYSDENYMIGKNLRGVTIHANNQYLFSTLESKDVKTIIVSPQRWKKLKLQSAGKFCG